MTMRPLPGGVFHPGSVPFGRITPFGVIAGEDIMLSEAELIDTKWMNRTGGFIAGLLLASAIGYLMTTSRT